MNRGMLWICDPDEMYAQCLARYMNGKHNVTYRVEAFSDLESLIRRASQQPPAVLLIEESMLEEAVQLPEASQICVLTSDPQTGSSHGYPAVFKYQDADALTAALLTQCTRSGRAAGVAETDGPWGSPRPGRAETEPETAARRSPEVTDPVTAGRGARILAVYSPVARCGKTCFAITLGEILAEHQRVLYLNMEDYHGFAELLGEGSMQPQEDLSDVLYDLRHRPDALCSRLGGITQTFRRLDYIPPTFNSRDLRSITMDEWEMLLKILAVQSGYDTLVLDIGTQIEDVARILTMSEIIYMPVLDGPFSRGKVRQMLANLDAAGFGWLRERMRMLQLPQTGGESVTRAFPSMLLRSELSEYIYRMLQETDEEGAVPPSSGIMTASDYETGYETEGIRGPHGGRRSRPKRKKW